MPHEALLLVSAGGVGRDHLAAQRGGQTLGLVAEHALDLGARDERRPVPAAAAADQAVDLFPEEAAS
jgi:hypothetical protein